MAEAIMFFSDELRGLLEHEGLDYDARERIIDVGRKIEDSDFAYMQKTDGGNPKVNISENGTDVVNIVNHGTDDAPDVYLEVHSNTHDHNISIRAKIPPRLA
jgi:hypothetical protein